MTVGAHSLQVRTVDNAGNIEATPASFSWTVLTITPEADAGSDQTVHAGTLVTLDGSGSDDANGDALTYAWSIVTKPAGCTAVLSSTTNVLTGFTADTYVISLVVNDGYEDSDPSNVSIIATSAQDEATQTLQDAVDVINGLDPGVFKNKNMANTLTNKINVVLEKIDQGLYQEAIDKLENDILKKTDGCAETGSPDKNDWIKDCGAQGQVYPFIMDAIGLLEGLINGS